MVETCLFVHLQVHEDFGAYAGYTNSDNHRSYHTSLFVR